MAASLDDFKPLLYRDGPISVVRENGKRVTYGTAGIATPVDPNLAQILKLEEIQIILFDENWKPTRAIRGDRILEVEQASPGWRIVVDDTVEPDEGATVKTRGA